MMRLLPLLLFMVAAIAGHGRITHLCLDSVSATAPCEGVWRMQPAGALFALRPLGGRNGAMEMTILFSERYAVLPYTVAGTLVPAAESGVFDASLAVDPAKGASRQNEHKFVIKYDARSGRLTFAPYRTSWRVNLNRLLPYLFRFSITRENTRPSDMDGAVRIAPGNAGSIVNL